METEVKSRASNNALVECIGLVAISALAYVLDDILHELGHTAAAFILGVKVDSISTIGISIVGVNPGVALAGPLFNLILGVALLFALVHKASPAWRYFAWVFGTINLFNGTAYLVYSAVLGTGDWAKVFGAITQPAIWRPLCGALGIVSYAASILASVVVLRRLCSSGVIARPNVGRYCATTFWAGGTIVTVGAIFNPINPWFILTSGAAVGFGATLGLWALPPLLSRAGQGTAASNEPLRIGWPWVLAGAVAAAVFIGVFGPGLRLSA